MRLYNELGRGLDLLVFRLQMRKLGKQLFRRLTLDCSPSWGGGKLQGGAERHKLLGGWLRGDTVGAEDVWQRAQLRVVIQTKATDLSRGNRK